MSISVHQPVAYATRVFGKYLSENKGQKIKGKSEDIGQENSTQITS
jgi:hypothetical protein